MADYTGSQRQNNYSRIESNPTESESNAENIPQEHDNDVNEAGNDRQQISQGKCDRYTVLFIIMFGFMGLVLVIFQQQLTAANIKALEMSNYIDDLHQKLIRFQTQYNNDIGDIRKSFSGFKSEVNHEITNFEVANEFIVNNVTSLSSEFKKSNATITMMANQLGNHDKLLIKLSNRTTNAEVLEKLKTTQETVFDQLATTNAQVTKTLELTSKNVSAQLNTTRAELGNTVLLMKSVVSDAEGHIYGIQRNVTNQLAKMTQSLNYTVANLNIAVMLAQATIHDEVNEVKSKIEEYVLATNVKFAAENDFVKYQLAGTFTLLGCLISLWHMTSHLRHYEKPDVQRRIMAVLWMVPIYGITSWLSLVFDQFEVIFAAVRDCYEAYAVYTFIALLIAVLEDGKGLNELLNMLTKHVVEERREVLEASRAGSERPKIQPKEHIKPPFPCCYVHHKPSSVAAAWLYQCKLMAMQFVIMKPLLTALPVVIELCGIDYHGQPLLRDGNLNFHAARVYIIILQNLSVAIAFYGLLSFYHGTEKDLAWCDPWPKFLCIKGVVFMTFWQGAALQAMSTTGWVDDHISSQIQNLLICIEMLIASIAHFYIFPYQEWQEGYKRTREQSIAIRDTLALKDFYKDMRQMVTRWEPSSVGDPPSSNDITPIKVSNEIQVDENLPDYEYERHGMEYDNGDIEMNRTTSSALNSTYTSHTTMNPLFPQYPLDFDEYYQSRQADHHRSSSSDHTSSKWFQPSKEKDIRSSFDESESYSLLHHAESPIQSPSLTPMSSSIKSSWDEDHRGDSNRIAAVEMKVDMESDIIPSVDSHEYVRDRIAGSDNVSSASDMRDTLHEGDSV